jgi:2,5-diketo-D-gluconate reductase A
MLRWHLQEGRSAIPKSTKPARIAENFDVFDVELSRDEVAAINARDTGVRRGPDPDSITLEAYGIQIAEA